MTQEIKILSDEEKQARLRFLRGRMRGMVAALVLMLVIAVMMIWQVSKQPKIDFGLLWPVALGLALLGATAWVLYKRIMLPMKADMGSDEKLLLSMKLEDIDIDQIRNEPVFILKADQNDDELVLGLRKLMSLTGGALNPEELEIGDTLAIEMTPHARIMTRIAMAGESAGT